MVKVNTLNNIKLVSGEGINLRIVPTFNSPISLTDKTIFTRAVIKPVKQYDTILDTNAIYHTTVETISDSPINIPLTRDVTTKLEVGVKYYLAIKTSVVGTDLSKEHVFDLTVLPSVLSSLV